MKPVYGILILGLMLVANHMKAVENAIAVDKCGRLEESNFEYPLLYNGELGSEVTDTIDSNKVVLNLPTTALSSDSNKIDSNKLVSNVPDSLRLDSAKLDSVKKKAPKPYKVSKDSLSAPVDYQALDSLIFDVVDQRMFLYGNAQIVYDKISLNAAYIEVDWKKNVITAHGMNDTTGHTLGKPVFKEKEQEYRADTIRYNYQTKKGKIKNLITKEGDGIVHGEDVKKMANDELYSKNAKYTTCEHEDPHFEIAISRLKVIPDKVLVAGPSNLVIADVPTPLYIPFGLFPLKKGRKSGIILPEFGDDPNRGFNLRNGGYYFAISDHMDLALTGDIYSRGSWRSKAASGYATRYKYRGNMVVDYSELRSGDPLTSDFQVKKDFLVDWIHKQDPKARPNSNFSADVHAGTSTFHTNNSLTADNRLNNQFVSSVNYSNNLVGTPFNLSVSLGHTQNTNTRRVDVTLPNAALSMNRLYPFKRKISTGGAKKWYESISVGYNAEARNKVNAADSVILKVNDLFFQNGVQHTAPISTNFKVFKYFTLNPRIDLKERWYWKTIKYNVADSVADIGRVEYLVKDTVSGFKAAHDFSTSMSLATKITGIKTFANGRIRGIRHLFTPAVAVSYRPDFSEDQWGYYETIEYTPDSMTKEFTYSLYQEGIYGTPPSGERAGFDLNLDNNFEMKWFSKKDTSDPEKKIPLIEQLVVHSFYNVAADSLNLDPITLFARTTLFKRFRLQYNSTYHPYVQDSTGQQIHQLEWDVNKRVARLKNRSLQISTFGFRFSSKQLGKKKEVEETESITEEEISMISSYPDNYVDFNVPWEFNIGYNLTINDLRDQYEFSKNRLYDTITIVQSLNFDFELNLTPKWRIDVNSGYDFVAREFTYTTINVHRDLHCWQMKFTWIPFGARQSWNFGINVKAPVLQDLKLNKRNNWYGT